MCFIFSPRLQSMQIIINGVYLLQAKMEFATEERDCELVICDATFLSLLQVSVMESISHR